MSLWNQKTPTTNTHRGPKPLIESPSTMRVVIVEGSLEEVLAVLHKLSKDTGESEALEPEVGGSDEHTQGNGHPPEKDTGAMPEQMTWPISEWIAETFAATSAGFLDSR